MEGARNDAATGVVNVNTMTVHRRDLANAGAETACGLTSHVDPNRLRKTALEEAAADLAVSKCGRCFEEAGGY